MSDVMGITRLSHLCTVNMVIQYMHAVTIIVFTQHLLTSLESLCKDDQKCSLGIIQLSRLPLA